MGRANPLRTALHVAAVTAFWVFYAYWFHRGTGYPWDFETYYYAASAALQGMDPYDTQNLVALAKRPVGMPFVYPPATLLLFAPFTAFEVHTADWIWLGIKTVAFAALIGLWLRTFLRGTPLLLLSFAAASAFNTAALWDLKVGNVAILEALLIWAGLAAYAQDRRGRFAVLIGLASIFKLTPILFLSLLLVPSKREPARPKPALAALIGLLLFLTVPLLIGPSWAREFLSNFPTDRPTGIVNPSALSIFDILLGSSTDPDLSARPLEGNVALALWVAFVLALLWVSRRALRAVARDRDPETLGLVSVFLFLLLSPRPMIYSYLLLIPSAIVLVSPLLPRGGAMMVVALMGLPAVARFLDLVHRHFFWDHYPFFLTLGFWLLYVAKTERRAALEGGSSLRCTIEAPVREGSGCQRI